MNLFKKKKYVLCKLSFNRMMFWYGKGWTDSRNNCPTYTLKKVKDYAKVMGCKYTEFETNY